MHSASGAMEEDDLGTWLGLGIGGAAGQRLSSAQFDELFPQSVNEERGRDHHQQAVNNKTEKGARKRSKSIDDGPSPSDGGDDVSDGGARKKLRLTQEQSTLLEDTFCVHNILSHAQKHELARQVNLSPRQVEVWFQNRRARTKLKQTEVNCELLKRCCESLTDENQRLKLELMERQRSAAAAGLYVHFPRAAPEMVNICPSCEKITVTSGGEASKSSSYSS